MPPSIPIPTPDLLLVLSRLPDLFSALRGIPSSLSFSYSFPSPSSLIARSGRRVLLCVAGVLAVGLAAKGVALARSDRRNPRRLPLPPGPRGLPFIGNVRDIPTVRSWEGYKKLCEQYGGMVYLEALGTKLLVVSDRKHAEELLEKRAVNYSDRPIVPMVEMLQIGWSFAFFQYDSDWREHRRAFHRYLNQHAIKEFYPVFREEAEAFVKKMREAPERFAEHIQFFFGAGIMRTAYGFNDINRNIPLIEAAEGVVQGFSEASTQGKFLVNTFPILRHVPAWFPGAGWRRRFDQLAQMSYNLLNKPFSDVKHDLSEGTSSPYRSMATSLLDELSEGKATGDPLFKSKKWSLEDVAKNVCAQAYLAGADTTVSSAMVLILALANNPGVQRKAQAEIDAVIGTGRLPLTSDRDALPYVHAIVKEANRYYTVVPLGVPHTCSEDDEYMGYFIPKDTIVLPNAWAIMHDEETFERPFDFVPERFIGKDGKIDESVPDPDYAAFGFGRRICPGRYFSNDVEFAFVAALLAMFDISPCEKDSEGNAVPLKLELMSHTVAKPLPFAVDIRVRPGRESITM